MLIVGVLLASVGIVLLVLAEYQRTQLRQLRAAERSTTKELAAYAESVSQALVEAGNYSQVAEVSGTVKCDAPLVSEVAKLPCVYYDARVSREYEESRYRGRRRRRQGRTRRGSEVVSSNTQRVPFWVEDAAGRIYVDPSGAEIEPVQIADRFEPAAPSGAGGSLTIGSFSITLRGAPATSEEGRRTIGYRFRERAIPLDRRVYVLGEVTDASGTLTIQKPSGKGRFVISLRSKEEIVRSVATRAQLITVAGAGSGATGLVVIALALLGML